MFSYEMSSLVNIVGTSYVNKQYNNPNNAKNRLSLPKLSFVDGSLRHPNTDQRTVLIQRRTHGKGMDGVSEASSSVFVGSSRRSASVSPSLSDEQRSFHRACQNGVCGDVAEYLGKWIEETDSDDIPDDLLSDALVCLRNAMKNLPDGMPDFVELFLLCQQDTITFIQLENMVNMGLQALDKIIDDPEHILFEALSDALMELYVRLLEESAESKKWSRAVKLLSKCFQNPHLEIPITKRLVDEATNLHMAGESEEALKIIHALPKVPASSESIVFELWKKVMKEVAAEGGREALAALDCQHAFVWLGSKDADEFKKMVFEACVNAPEPKSASYCNALCRLFRMMDPVPLNSVTLLVLAISELWEEADVVDEEFKDINRFLDSLSIFPISPELLLYAAVKLSSSPILQLRTCSASLLTLGTDRAVSEGELSQEQVVSIANAASRLVAASVGADDQYVRKMIEAVLRCTSRRKASLFRIFEGLLHALLTAVGRSRGQMHTLVIMRYFVALYGMELSERPELNLAGKLPVASVLARMAITMPEAKLKVFYNEYVEPFMRRTRWPDVSKSKAIYNHFKATCQPWLKALLGYHPRSDRARFFRAMFAQSLEGVEGTVPARSARGDRDIRRVLKYFMPNVLCDAMVANNRAYIQYFLTAWRNHISELAYGILNPLFGAENVSQDKMKEAIDAVAQEATLGESSEVANSDALPHTGIKRKDRPS